MKSRVVDLARMKNVAFALVISLVAHAGSVYAACTSEACKRAVSWKNGYTAIILEDDIARDNYLAVLDAVKASGGVVAIEAESVLLGWLPKPAAAKIRAVAGIRAVLYDAVTRPADLVRREGALPALEFFNRVLTGEYEDAVEAGLAVTGEPLTTCVVQRKTRPTQSQSQSLATPSDADTTAPADVLDIQGPVRIEPGPMPKLPAPIGRVSPNYWGLLPLQNPDMRGRVAVQLFRLDSDGAVDQNTYTWSTGDFAFAADQVYGAFTFWVNEATYRGVTLSYNVQIRDPFSRYTRSFYPTPTRYEPIFHNWTDDYLWVNDALARLGYGASPVTQDNVYRRNEDFNRDMKNDPYWGQFDRSFSVYIIYNPGPEIVFADGQRPYAIPDGPFTMMMWNSAGWGPNNLGLVLTHEAGHIFWACDEYWDAATQTGCDRCDYCWVNLGPRPYVSNANCDNAGATGCDNPRVNCVMRQISYAVCPHTPPQIGW